jgi:hypothetical protein
MTTHSITLVGFRWVQTELPAALKNRTFRIPTRKPAVQGQANPPAHQGRPGPLGSR